MPYIKKSDRGWYDERVDNLFIEEPGQLNYVITRLAQNYVKVHGINYKNYNEVLGVLEAVKLELYRRAITPYEDKKIAENGDVYYIVKESK